VVAEKKASVGFRFAASLRMVGWIRRPVFVSSARFQCPFSLRKSPM
jgi:hypothetical protein